VNPEITDRFEFFIGGREIGNGFSELNDARRQAQRFQDQVNAKAAGDDEAMFYDEDYVTALEYGLPTAGLGIGIDRMVMLFTNSHTIRDNPLPGHASAEVICCTPSRPAPGGLPHESSHCFVDEPVTAVYRHGVPAGDSYSFCNVPRWLPFVQLPLKASLRVKLSFSPGKSVYPGWLSRPPR
jgi:hypothetical protein